MSKLAALLQDDVRKVQLNLRSAEARWEDQAAMFGVDSPQAEFYLALSAHCEARLAKLRKDMVREDKAFAVPVPAAT